MLTIGLGFSSECSAAEIVTLIGQVCATHSIDRAAITLIATLPERAMAPALIEAAAGLGLAIVVPPVSALTAAAKNCLTQSERAQNRFGLPSVAEACALAAAGEGARLLAARTKSARATCAFADAGGANATSRSTP